MINTIKKLADIATELGGTTYEIAQSGGLLSAARFLEIHTEPGNEQLPKNVKVVTEVYVRFEEREELDRVFLYRDDMQSDKELLEIGDNEDGKLVIAYDRLKDLAAKGYKCIYNRSADGHNGKAFARYHAVFGENKMMLPFKMWDSKYFFMGNGHNRALLVTTKFERVFVMPDTQAVRESILVVHAENLIREKKMTDFRIERIRWKREKGRLPEAYGRLEKQIGFIKSAYPEVYEVVWRKKGLQLQEGQRVSLGICMDYCRTFGVCRMPDGTVRRIPNVERTTERFDDRKYHFAGYKDFSEGDATIADLPIILKHIIASAEITYKVMVDKIYVTVVDNGLCAFDMPGDRACTEAGLPEIEYVDYYAAIMSAYGEVEEVKQMEENEIALLYDFGEIRLAPALVEKCSDHTFRLIHRIEVEEPEDGIFSEDDDFSYVYKDTFQDVYEDEWGEPMVPGLREIMWSDMDHFMLDAGLRELRIDDKRPADKKAFDRMHGDWERIKRQLLRNNSAPIVFDNGYLSITMDYPIGRLEKCFAPIMRNSDVALHRLFEESGILKEDISVVVSSGENSEYPFVQRYIEEFTDKESYIVNFSEFTAARGAVLYKMV